MKSLDNPPPAGPKLKALMKRRKVAGRVPHRSGQRNDGRS